MQAARRSGDKRLFAIADVAASPSARNQFKPILDAIDKMVALLQDEENQDLETKQTCEKDRMADTRDAILDSREIDDNTDKINKLIAEIEQCKKTIEQLQADHKATKEALAKAQRQRDDENAAFKKTDADDKLAAETVANAKNVLEGFYKDNGLALIQQPVSGMEAGAAPPPPPATFEGEYGGKTGESQGIIAIMEMVESDIKKDRADAQADEDSSLEEFNAFKKDSEDKMKSLKAEETATDKRMGKAELDKTNTEKSRAGKKDELNGVLAKIEGINPNCEYYEVNYPMRTANRQIEIDGLNKAKAILNGGTFDKAPDPNREIKPGDAFLQKRA